VVIRYYGEIVRRKTVSKNVKWECQIKEMYCEESKNSIIIVGFYVHCERFRCDKNRPVEG